MLHYHEGIPEGSRKKHRRIRNEAEGEENENPLVPKRGARVPANVKGCQNMNLKEVTIRLSPSEVVELLRIDMDDDPARALDFVKEVLAKRVKESLQPH
jgi:hypothetical protein